MANQEMTFDTGSETPGQKQPKGIKFGRLKQNHPRLDLGRMRMLHALYRGGNHLLSDNVVMDFVFGKIGDESDVVYHERRRRAFYENLFAMVINQISAGLAQDPCRLVQPEAPMPDIPVPGAPPKKPNPFAPEKDDAEKKPKNPFAKEEPEADEEADTDVAPVDPEGDTDRAEEDEEEDYFEDPDLQPQAGVAKKLAPEIDQYWIDLMQNATVRHDDGGSERTFDQVMRDICVEALTCGWSWYQVDLPKPTYDVKSVEPKEDDEEEEKPEKKPVEDQGEETAEEDAEAKEKAKKPFPKKEDAEEDDEEVVGSISLLDQEKAGDLNAYIATWPTDAITDWEEVDGRVLWVRTYECINLSLTPDAPRWPDKDAKRIHRWTIWTPECWEKYDIEETKEKPLSAWNDDAIVPVADTDKHTFGRVPWIRFDLCTPGTYLHVGDLIESLCRSYFNRSNGESWQWMQACFQQLYEFLAPEMAGIDTPISQAQQDPNRALKQRRAPGIVHVRGENDKAMYVAPNMSGADIGKAATQDLRDAVLRVTSQMALAQDTSGAMLRRSADSKKQDSVAQEIIMGAVGKRLLIGAMQAIKLCAIARGDDPEAAPELEGYTRFSVDDSTTLINDTVLLDAVDIPSATYQVERKYRVAASHLGDDVSPEKLKRIRMELEQSITQDQMGQAPGMGPDGAPVFDPSSGEIELDKDGNPIEKDLDEDGNPIEPAKPPAQGGKPPFGGGFPPKKKFGGKPPWMKKKFGGPRGRADDGPKKDGPAPGHQEKPWSCGPASLVSACETLGIIVSEARVRELSDADKDGTDEEQLLQAADALGLEAEVQHSGDAEESWDALTSAVADGLPCVLCVDQWDHWVTVVGIVGDRVVMLDSSNEKDNVDVNGVHFMTKAQLLKRWKHKGVEKSLYAIAFSKK